MYCNYQLQKISHFNTYPFTLDFASVTKFSSVNKIILKSSTKASKFL